MSAFARGAGGGLDLSALANNVIARVVGGALVNSGISDDGSSITLARRLLGVAGATGATAAYSFTGSPNSSMGEISLDKIGFWLNTTLRFWIDENRTVVAGPLGIGTDGGSGAPDIGLARAAAGVLKITNGSSGDGGLIAATLYGPSNLVIGPAQGGIFQIKNGSTGGNVLVDIAAASRFALSSNIPIKWSSTAAADGSYDTGLARLSAGIITATNGSTGIRGFMGGGAAVASATAMPVPTGRVFHVTGTTDITSITSTNIQAGTVITIIFDGVLTFTDGNNLKLAGNFVTSADDTITLIYDGTNWYETSRSVN